MDALEVLTKAVVNQPSQMAALMLQNASFEAKTAGVPELSQDMGHMGHHAPRPKTAYEKVMDHLELYPQDWNMSVRDLAARTAVGKSTVQRVFSDRKQ